MAQEIIRATVPANNKWHTEDIEKKAADLGIDKGEFILKAVDMLLNFDETFYKKIQWYAEGLKIPEYMVIQNFIIDMIENNKAISEVWGSNHRVLPFFMVEDDKGARTLTGDELRKERSEYYKREEMKKKAELEGRRKGL